MRRLLPTLAILGAFAAQPAMALPQCAAPADQAIFEVQALRSHFVVLATGCPNDSAYSAFVGKYKATLLANDQALTAWFKKRYGARGQFEHDQFVTDLTNAMSSDANRQGVDFCAHDGVMFQEVMALTSGNDLPAYAAAKDLIPASVRICPGTAPKAAPRRAAHR